MYNIMVFNSDYSHYVAHWLGSRDMDSNLSSQLPKCGMIAFKDKEPIAAGFIREVEGCDFGIFDSLITNPGASAHDRNKVLDVLVEGLLTLAKAKGFKKILAFSVDKNTLIRSLKHGFVHLPHTVISSDLSEV